VTHGNFTVFCLFARRSDFFAERSAETFVAFTEGFCSYRNAWKTCYTMFSIYRSTLHTDIDGAGNDLIGDVLSSSQARGAEPRSMRTASGIWESSCEESGTTIISSLAVTYVSKADVSNKSWIDVAPLSNLLQCLEDQSVKWRVFQSTLLIFA
jgi:hypothetical protein